MKDFRKSYTNLEDIDKDALEEFFNYVKVDLNRDPTKAISDIDSVIDLIYKDNHGEELSYNDEDYDSDYITNVYSLELNDFLFEVFGQSYIKDRTICDEELVYELFITNLKEKKEYEKVQKQIKKLNKEKKQKEDSIKWDNFFENKTKDELLTELKQYKFPIK